MHWEIWGKILMFLTFQMRCLERPEITRESFWWPDSLGRRTICDVVEIHGSKFYMDLMPFSWSQDSRKRILPSDQFHQHRSLKGERQTLSSYSSHWQKLKIFFIVVQYLPELGDSDPGNFSLILLLGVGCCRRDRGKFLWSRFPVFPLILESEAEGSQESLLPSS